MNSSAVDAHLSTIEARLGTIIASLKEVVEEIKAQRYETPPVWVHSTPAIDPIISFTGSEPEDEGLVKGIVPSVPPVSAFPPPSPPAATPQPTITNLPSNYTCNYIPPRLTTPSNNSLPSPKNTRSCLIIEEKDVTWAQLVNQIQIESEVKKSGTNDDEKDTIHRWKQKKKQMLVLQKTFSWVAVPVSVFIDLRTSRFTGREVLIRTQNCGSTRAAGLDPFMCWDWGKTERKLYVLDGGKQNGKNSN